MRAIIYARVSQDRSGQQRSVSEQESECRAEVDRRGWTLVDVVVDNDRSASAWARGQREGWLALQQRLADGEADVLVAWEASRTTRDLAEHLALRQLCVGSGVLLSYGGRLIDLARTDDRFTAGLDALLAEREASLTRDRVRRTMRAQAQQGKPHGKVPYGYVRTYDPRSGQLLGQEPDPEVAPLIREAAARVLAGETLRTIARDWNARGVTTPRGAGEWDPTQVRRTVTLPYVVGDRVHNGRVIVRDAWPGVLDRETWQRCVALLSDPARRTQRDSAVRWLLSGIAVCGACDDGPIRVGRSRSHHAYICKKFQHLVRKVEVIDQYVTAVILARLRRPDAVALLTGGGDAAASAAAAEAVELRARLDALVDQAVAGDLSAAALARAEAALLPRIEQAERAARPTPVPDALADLVGADDLDQRWEQLTLEQRRAIIRALCTIRLHKARQGARSLDPATVQIAWHGDG